MKYIIGINKTKNIEELKQYTNKFLIGLKEFTIGMNNYFSFDEIFNMCKSNSKCDFYLNLNRFVLEENINTLENILKKLKKFDNCFYIITDLGILNMALKSDFSSKIIIDFQNLTTNSFDFNFFQKYHINGSFISNELHKNEIKEILENKKITSYYYGFGYIPLFFSRREHIRNYLKFNNISQNLEKDHYSLKEETREEQFNILEEQQSFIIYRPNLFYLIKEIEYFKNLDYFVFNPIFFTDEQLIPIVEKITNNEKLKMNYDEGFLNREIIYKKEC